MRGRLFAACVWAGAWSPGCSTKESDTDGGAVDTTATASELTATGPGEATGDDPTGGVGSHEICERYLGCLAVVAPSEASAAEQGFGPDGTCWQGTQEMADLCLMACEEGLAAGHAVKPSAPACALCQADGDCPQGQECRGGACKPPPVIDCGNGVVDSGEVCDGGAQCDADCMGPAACSPLTQAGCGEGEQCLVQFPDGAFCGASADRPVPGQPCDPGEACEAGAYCFAWAGCPGGCCFNPCDVNEPETCPPGTECVGDFQFIEALDYLGYCY